MRIHEKPKYVMSDIIPVFHLYYLIELLLKKMHFKKETSNFTSSRIICSLKKSILINNALSTMLGKIFP